MTIPVQMRLVLVLLLAVFAAPAWAQIHDHRDTGFGMDHAMLASSDPPDGAELAEAPPALTLVFRHPVRLGVLSIRSAAGEDVTVAWPAERRSARHVIALPRLAPGAHWVSFTATADTGETMPGVIHFNVAQGTEASRK